MLTLVQSFHTLLEKSDQYLLSHHYSAGNPDTTMNSKKISSAGMQKFRKIIFSKFFIAAVFTMLAYTLIGFFLVPYLVKRQLTQFVTHDLQRQVEIQAVHVNPYKLTLAVQGLDLKEQDGKPLLAFNRLFANFETKSLFRWAWTFAEIQFDKPKINFEINSEGQFNLVRLLNSLSENSAQKEADTGDGEPPRLIFEKILITEGQVEFLDLQGATPADVSLKSLNIELADLSTLPEREGPYTIRATTPAGESLQWQGTVSLHPIASHGTLAVTGIQAAGLWEFVYDDVNCDVTDGSLDLETRYSFTYDQQTPQLLLEGLTTRVSNFRLQPRGATDAVLSLSEVLLKETRLDLAARKLILGSLQLQGGQVITHVDAAGILNWQQLFSSGETQPPAQKQPETNDQENPWQVDLNAAEIGGLAIHYTDASRMRPVELSLTEQAINFSGTVALAPGDIQTVLEDISVSLSDIELKEPAAAAPLLQINNIDVGGGKFDLKQRAISVEQVNIKSGAIQVIIDPQRNVNWVQLTAQDPGLIREASGEALDEAQEEGRPWSFAVAAARLADFRADVSDHSTEPVTSLVFQEMDLNLNDITSNPDLPIRFEGALRINQKGRLSSQGEIYAMRPSLDAELQLQNLELAFLQPYMNAVASLVIDAGMLDGSGRLRYGDKGATARLVFDGGMSLKNLAVLESKTKKPYLGWKLFEAPKINLTLEPDKLDIPKIRILEPVSKLIIFKDKSVNLARVLKPGDGQRKSSGTDEKKKKGEAGQGEFPLTIQRVRIEKGNLDFADLSLVLPFSARIQKLHGVITGISSKPNSRAAIKLEGRVDKYGIARVEGRLMPYEPKNFTDIAVTFQNVEMTSLTPYTATFAGYQIESGKLSLDLEYKVESGKLQGQNAILIDQLFLGERVDSPGAMDLPLEFAIALLKDQDGRIDLDLPVSGDVDNPEFSYGQLVLKAIGNLITSIVTAPFKLIGAMLGVEDAGLDTIEFDPGSDRLLPPEQEKLKHVAAAMKKRPQLQLEVQGQYHAELDGMALRSRALNREFAGRLGIEIEPGGDPGPIDLGDTKNQKVLEKLYIEYATAESLSNLKDDYTKSITARKKAARSNSKKFKPPPGEFHEQLYTRLERQWPLNEDAPVALAHSRAETIAREITGQHGLAAARVLIKDSAPAGKDAKKAVPSKLGFGVHK